MRSDSQLRDVIIIGAGPTGLACGIEAEKGGLDYLLIEKGCIVNSIHNFPVQMTFFTTPELLEIGGLPLITPYQKPTRIEALKPPRRPTPTNSKFTLRNGDTGLPAKTIASCLRRPETRNTTRTMLEGGGSNRLLHIPNSLNIPGEICPVSPLLHSSSSLLQPGRRA
jgi:thioredoxin reductase (NADPH)